MLAESPLARRTARGSRRWSKGEEERGIVNFWRCEAKEVKKDERQLFLRSLRSRRRRSPHKLDLFFRGGAAFLFQEARCTLQVLTSGIFSSRRTRLRARERERERERAKRKKLQGERPSTTVRSRDVAPRSLALHRLRSSSFCSLGAPVPAPETPFLPPVSIDL